MSETVILSEQALRRIPRYLWYLKELQCRQQETVSAPSVARQLGLNEVLVRKELSLMSTIPGRPRTGFQVNDLVENMELYLGYRNLDDAVLVGVGSLGNALLGNIGFDRCGVRIVAAFDRNEGLDGLTLSGKPVFSAKKITSLCRRLGIRIGIITVDAEQAQFVCDQLVDGGVLAIWNFAPTQLRVPKEVLVRNEDLPSSLALLSHQLKERLG